MDPFSDREKSEAVYGHYAILLADLVLRAGDHSKRVPDCPADPVCIGAEPYGALVGMLTGEPGSGALCISVAVHELRKAGDRIEGLERRLEIQRGMTGEMALQADRLEEDNQALLGRIDALENGVSRDDA